MAARVPVDKKGPVPARGRLGVAAAGIAVVLWALSNVLVKEAHTGAFVFAFWRLWLGAAGLWVTGMVTGRRLTRRVLRAVWPAGLMFAINLVASFSALRLTTVANVSLIGALQPALVLTFAGRLFGEVATRWRIAWTVVSVGGVAVVLFGSPRGPEFRPAGDALAFVGLVVWVVFLVASKRARATIPAFEFMTGVLLVAALSLTPFMAAWGRNAAGPRGIDWALIAAVAFVSGTGGHLLVTWAHRHIDLSVMSLVMVTQPIIATVMARAWLSEPVTLVQTAGGVVALLSLAMVVRGRGSGRARARTSATTEPEDLEPGV